MIQTKFMAYCPYELGDNVKIVLDSEKNILSQETYEISDIITLHSLRSGEVNFEIIAKDYMNRDLAGRKISDFKLVEKRGYKNER